jgi:hypothetical protein
MIGAFLGFYKAHPEVTLRLEIKAMNRRSAISLFSYRTQYSKPLIPNTPQSVKQSALAPKQDNTLINYRG